MGSVWRKEISDLIENGETRISWSFEHEKSFHTMLATGISEDLERPAEIWDAIEQDSLFLQKGEYMQVSALSRPVCYVGEEQMDSPQPVLLTIEKKTKLWNVGSASDGHAVNMFFDAFLWLCSSLGKQADASVANSIAGQAEERIALVLDGTSDDMAVLSMIEKEMLTSRFTIVLPESFEFHGDPGVKISRSDTLPRHDADDAFFLAVRDGCYRIEMSPVEMQADLRDDPEPHWNISVSCEIQSWVWNFTESVPSLLAGSFKI